MKNGIIIIVSVIITSLIWMIVLKESHFDHLREVEKMVHMPTRAILGDLKATAASGDQSLLKEKIDLLELKWRRYTEGGEGPAYFRENIMNLKGQEPKTERAK